MRTGFEKRIEIQLAYSNCTRISIFCQEFQLFWKVYGGVLRIWGVECIYYRVQNSSRLPATAGTLVTLAGDFSQK